MHIISMKQLREQFEPIRDGLDRGESYLLMYRSKPLATLLPYEHSSSNQEPFVPKPNQAQKESASASPAHPVSLSSTTPEHKPGSQLQKFGLKKMLSP